MTVQLELWHLILLLLAFFGCVFAFSRTLLGQFEKRLEEKFKAQEESRVAGSASLRDGIEKYTVQGVRTADQVQQLERDFLKWQADMPLQYVRREDYVRNQTIIESKLDGLALRLENIQLKGLRHD